MFGIRKLFLYGVFVFVAAGCQDTEQTQGNTAASIEKRADLENIDARGLKKLLRSSDAKVHFVNMWATWCKPCVEEFPYLLRLRENYKDQGFNLIFVSMDMLEQEAKVHEFLLNQNVDFKTYFKDQGDHEFIEGISGEWSGALPATFVYDGSGNQLAFWTGDKSYEEFETELKNYLTP